MFLPCLAYPSSCPLISSLVKIQQVFLCGLVAIRLQWNTRNVFLMYKNIKASVTHSPGILEMILKETFPGEQ